MNRFLQPSQNKDHIGQSCSSFPLLFQLFDCDRLPDCSLFLQSIAPFHAPIKYKKISKFQKTLSKTHQLPLNQKGWVTFAVANLTLITSQTAVRKTLLYKVLEDSVDSPRISSKNANANVCLFIKPLEIKTKSRSRNLLTPQS